MISRRIVLLVALLITPLFSAHAADTTRIHVTVLEASNEGTDINLENDVYRDQLLNLFSYTAYEQVNKIFVDLLRAERTPVSMPGGYELFLTLQGEDAGRISLQAVIRKGTDQYVDTVLTLLKPGVVFLGGPPVGEGKVLILVLERRE